jgi:hypothetical protein
VVPDQDHRAIKRVTKPTLNFKFFRPVLNARTKGQFMIEDDNDCRKGINCKKQHLLVLRT